MNDSVSMQVAAWLQGVGTVGAVVLALFLQVFLVWYRRPRIKMEVSIDHASQDLHPAVKEDYGHNICWLRGRVLVYKGKDPATNVEVIVQDWDRPVVENAPFAHDNYLSWANGADNRIRIPASVDGAEST